MTFKLKDLMRIRNSVKKLVGQSVKIHVMFRLRHFVQDVDKEMRTLDEMRTDIIKRLGVRKGQSFSIPENDVENQEKYETEYKLLLEEEVEIRVAKVKLSDFEIAREGSDIIETPAGEGVIKVPPLNILDIANLSFLFEDEPEGKSDE